MKRRKKGGGGKGKTIWLGRGARRGGKEKKKGNEWNRRERDRGGKGKGREKEKGGKWMVEEVRKRKM